MNLNIKGATVPTTFNIVCSECDFTGTGTIDMAANIKQIEVGESINFKNGDDNHICPVCHKGYIYAKGGKYIRNEKTNVMERVGDYEG
ncbi:hypothetical protein D3C76_1304830 [compost metagenome]